MIPGYETVTEVAKRWNCTPMWVIRLLPRVPGVQRLGHEWAVPAGAERPKKLKPGPKDVYLDSYRGQQ